MSLPEDATALARLVVDPNIDHATRNSAWEKLAPVIQKIACNVSFHYYCSEIEEEAVSYIWDRMAPNSDYKGKKYNPDKCRRFERWCDTVLIRRTLDILDRPRAQRYPVEAEQISATNEGRVDIFTEELEKRRNLLDEICDKWPAKKRKYYSVFLFHLSWTIGVAIRKNDEPSDSVASDVEAILPWRANERQMRRNDNWPTWGELWKVVGEHLNKIGAGLGIHDLCGVLNSVLEEPINTALWNQWVKRAKDNAVKIVSAEDWQEYFAKLFPSQTQQIKGDG